MTENFTNLGKKMNFQIQEAQQIPNKMELKNFKPRQIMMKLSKSKAVLKAAREK